MTFAGIFLAGVSVAIFKASDFGTDPNSCFVMGVWNLAGIKYSYVYIAINALMLLGVFFLDRHFIGLGTVLNLFFMGIIVEKGMQLFDRYLPERTFGVRVILMCIAVVMMCFASALYFIPARFHTPMTKQELGSVPKSDALKMATLTPARKIPANVMRILFTVNEFIFLLYTSDQIF